MVQLDKKVLRNRQLTIPSNIGRYLEDIAMNRIFLKSTIILGEEYYNVEDKHIVFKEGKLYSFILST